VQFTKSGETPPGSRETVLEYQSTAGEARRQTNRKDSTMKPLIAALALFACAGTALAEDVTVITELYAAMEAQPYDADAMAAKFTDTYVDHNRAPGLAPPDASDKQWITGLIGALNSGFPDGKRTLNLVETLSDGRVIVQFTFDGTNTGSFFGGPATGKVVHFNGFDLFRIEDGLIAEQWHVEEVAALNAQLSAP
jgi:predicted SnoaL-like aldol condensation-catalyzing enzyme